MFLFVVACLCCCCVFVVAIADDVGCGVLMLMPSVLL